MKIAWTESAKDKYVAYFSDRPVRESFDLLVDGIYDDPDDGFDLDHLVNSAATNDPLRKRVAAAFRKSKVPSGGLRAEYAKWLARRAPRRLR